MKFKKLAIVFFSAITMVGDPVVYADGIPIIGGDTTVVEATCRLPIIKVSVPATGAVYINPFQLSVQMGSENTKEQIVSIPTNILNESEVPMSVDVTVTGSINEGSDLSLSTVTTKGSELTSKEAFVYFEMKAVKLDDPNLVTWDKVYDEEKHVVVCTTAKTKKNVVTLDAWDENGQKNCYGAFRLTGDCVTYPKTEWNSKDGLNVEIAFTFTPSISENQ